MPLARILIVDDNAAVLELVSTRLELGGFATVKARDGYVGLRRLRDLNIDAMILDLDMPRLSGLGVLEQMKSLGPIGRVPTMIPTASHQAADVQLAVQLGAKDFLGKPFEDHVLLSRVARLVRMGGASRMGPGADPTSRTPSLHV